MRIATLFVLSLACGGEATAPAPEGKADARLDVVLESADGLQAYVWDGRLPVPAVQRGGPVVLPWGAVGCSADTSLYLPLDEGAGVPGDASAAGRPVTGRGLSWTDGRFGPGLAFDGGGELVVESGPAGEPLLAEPFTLELWLRPARLGREQHVLSVRDAFELVLEKSGRLALVVAAEPPLLLRTQPVHAGWNQVAVVHGGLPLHPFRLVVNGDAAQRVVDEPPSFRAPLVVGGEGPAGRRPLRAAIDDLRITARAAATSELVGRGAPPEPGPHELRLVREGAADEVRDVWAGALQAPRAERAPELASADRWQVAVRDDRLVWTPAQWERDFNASPPTARTAHATTFLGDGRLFLFGGEGRDSHANPQINVDDTWLYRIDERRWERVPTETQPSPRCHVPCAYSSDHDLVLLVGGYLNGQFVDNRTMSDTWAYYPSEARWEELDPRGRMQKHCDTALVYHPRAKAFLMFLYSSVLVYEPENDAWIRLPDPEVLGPEGEPVDYAFGGSPMAGYDPESHRILLFGGVVEEDDGGERYQDETAWYDFRTNTLHVEEHDVAPSPRVRSGFAYDPRGERFVLFGGVQDQYSQRRADLWVYDVRARSWEELEAANGPSARGGYYGMVYDPEAEVFVLACGRHSPQRFLNEVWRLYLDPEREGTATYVFERAAFEGRRSWFVDWRAPEGTAPRARFRGDVGDGQWSEWSDEPGGADLASAERVQVELRLPPATDEAPSEVLGLGFLEEGEGDGPPAGARRSALPLFGGGQSSQ